MQHKIPVIAIFDIGKTNKKFFLFDEKYQIVMERSAQWAEIFDEDGFECENLVELQNWIRHSITEVMNSVVFQIKACNISAYGASLVHVDKQGNPVTALYNYLKPFPPGLQEKIYDAYGGVEKVILATASPLLGNLNAGMQLIRLKYELVELYNQIAFSLHLPQYLSYLLTGKYYAEMTSIGCHTALWDYSKKTYHDWAIKENILPKLPAIVATDTAIDTHLHGHSIQSGVGIHDSSAALVPYLMSGKEPFILLSTGTWSISLNPFNQDPLTAAELAQDCLCYTSYQGHPVKAARIFAGHEHEQQVKRLAAHFLVEVDYYKKMVYQNTLAQKVSAEKNTRTIELGLHPSYFAHRSLSQFLNYEEAYHQLLFDIICQQQLSTTLVLGTGKVSRIFVDGGFANNLVYMHMLADAFPHMKIYAASVSQASAIGAALVMHKHWNKRELPEGLVKTERIHLVNFNH